MRARASHRSIVFCVLAGLFVLFALLVSLRVHGFSIAKWHAVLDGSPATEVLLGEPRYIRADDWLVQLPLAFAQAAHDPAFPVENTKIGLGQNMLLPIEGPVAHPISLFRPTQWGFFLGNDIGMSWLWWSQVLGLAGVFFLVSSILTRGHLALSATGSLFLLVAPFFQFWAFTKSTIPLYLGLAFVATTRLLSQRSPWAIGLSALLLGWAGVAFTAVLYPPFQIPLLYLYIVLLGTWAWEQRDESPWQERFGLRLTAGLGAAGLAAATLALLYLDAREPIDLMLGTVYPGHRVSTGGETAPWRLLTAHFASGALARDFRALGNIVEASSFLVLFPVVGLAMIWGRVRDPVAIGLLCYCLVAVTYQTFGIPAWLARGTLLSFVPGERLLLGLGIADALLLLRFLSLPREQGPIAPPAAVGIALLWSGLVLIGGRTLQSNLPGMTLLVLVVGCLLQGGFAFAIARRLRPVAVLAVLCLGVAATTLHFNPFTRGGGAYLEENSLSRAIKEIDAAHSGQSSWVVYESSDLPNLIRTIGVRSFGGAIALPQLSLWKRLDPQRRAIDVYNRYAHVGFRPPRDPGRPAHFRLSSHHGFLVYLDPEGSELASLGVTHLLVRARERTKDYWGKFTPLRVEGRHSIFALPLTRRDSDDAR